MKKNDIVTLKITDMTIDGNGVGRIEADGSADNGMTVFVAAAAIGDIISCRIVKVLKTMCYGIIDSIITPSPDREDRGCRVRTSCGGCVFRHISYAAELKIKELNVKNAFLRIGGFSEDELYMLPIMGCSHETGYRNKAQYPVALQNGKAVCGFYARRSHRVIPCTNCLLQPDIFGDIAEFVLKYANDRKIAPYNEEDGSGLLRHIYLRRGYHSGDIMLCIVAKKMDKRFYELGELAVEKFPCIRSVILNVNPRKTNVILGEEYITLAGSDTIDDIMSSNRITLSPASFYQVNTEQAERLYAAAADFAGLSGSERILELYCGAGTITLSMARRAKHITGAEIVPQAVENARRNAIANGIGNVDFVCADAGEAARKVLMIGEKPDVIITDPPRKGCDELTIASIAEMSPERVVMISCNPSTAARDCRMLANKGYILKKLRAVDMFPGTGHVETVVLLSREFASAKDHVYIDYEPESDIEFPATATYTEIKSWIQKEYGLKVSSLYVAQVKQKHGIIEHECHNKPKSENSTQPQCPPEKEAAIEAALKHFKMIKKLTE